MFSPALWAIASIGTPPPPDGSITIVGVTASSHDGNVPENTLDSDLSTRWSADGKGQWIRFQLSDIATLDHLNIAFYRGVRRTTRFAIELSLDGTNWNAALPNGQSSSTSNELESFSFSPAAAKFVRIVGDGNTENDFISLTQVSLLIADQPDGDGGDGDGLLDVFGITRLHPSLPGPEWDSRHWANGQARTLTGSRPHDAGDPTGWSRHKGSSGYRIDGQGVLWLDSSLAGGEHPRFYIDPTGSGQGWTNVELTLYFLRGGSDTGGGISCGVRTVTGSHDPSGDHCLANTYYARITGGTYTDMGKELVHADTTFRAKKNLPSLSPFPQDKWIGFKLVCRNFGNNRKVRLQSYLDMTNGANGGTWQNLNAVDDAGGWPGGNDLGTGVNGGDRELAGCRTRHPRRFPDGNHTIMTGVSGVAGDGGAVFTRNGPARNVGYKWMSVREIPPLP